MQKLSSTFELSHLLYFCLHCSCSLWLAATNKQNYNKVDPKLQSQILVGASAIFWYMWLTRNDIVFDKKNCYSNLQVIFSVTYYTRLWSILQNEADQLNLKQACRMMEIIAMEIFTKNEWLSYNRVCA